MKHDFLSQLESRMDENKQLTQGGLPRWLAPLGSLIGFYPWQSLVGISLLISLGLWLVLGSLVNEYLEIILLVW